MNGYEWILYCNGTTMGRFDTNRQALLELTTLMADYEEVTETEFSDGKMTIYTYDDMGSEGDYVFEIEKVEL